MSNLRFYITTFHEGKKIKSFCTTMVVTIQYTLKIVKTHLYSLQMDGNPWQVDSLQDFLFLKCPECTFDTQEEENFENHASENHPLSFVFFGKTFMKEENVNLEESYSEDYKDPLTINGEIKNQSDITPSENLALAPIFSKLSNIKEEDNFEKLPNVKKEDFYTTNNLEEDGYMTKKCPECDFSTPNPKKLRIHIRKLHKKKKNEKPKPHKCSKCDKNYTTAKSLRQHFRLIHEETKLETKEEIKQEPNEKIENYSNPERPQEGSQNKKCSICDKIFSTAKAVKTHIEMVHDKIKPFLCTICGYKCYNQQTLEIHISAVHEGKKPHVCSHCGKSFGLKESLKRHIACVHEGKKSFQCNDCGTMFSEKRALKLHIITVHEGKKLNKCPECDKSFGLKCNLTKHIRTVHEGIKAFQCDLCGSKFSQKASVKDHIAEVHEKTSFQTCPLCQKTFSKMSNLKFHITTVHEGKKYVRKDKAKKIVSVI